MPQVYNPPLRAFALFRAAFTFGAGDGGAIRARVSAVGFPAVSVAGKEEHGALAAPLAQLFATELLPLWALAAAFALVTGGALAAAASRATRAAAAAAHASATERATAAAEAAAAAAAAAFATGRPLRPRAALSPAAAAPDDAGPSSQRSAAEARAERLAREHEAAAALAERLDLAGASRVSGRRAAFRELARSEGGLLLDAAIALGLLAVAALWTTLVTRYSATFEARASYQARRAGWGREGGCRELRRSGEVAF
jgi:hypothetical protein